MIRIKNKAEALFHFEEAAIKHSMATQSGDYTLANMNYELIAKSVAFLKQESSIDALFNFLTHPSVGVRLTAATHLLARYERKAIRTLKELSKRTDIHALTAKTVLSEWEKGKLHL